MFGHGQRLVFDILAWFVVVTAFLLNDKISQGTGLEVFQQNPSTESYKPDYKIYHNLSRLNECIHDLVSRYPNLLDAQMKYRSRWGLSQYVLRFANLTKKTTKNTANILFSFGEHSSEYLPVESMIYLLENLTAGMDDQPGSFGYNFTSFVLSNIDLYIIGMFNPDGRTIVEKTHNYCWKETGSRADLNNNDGSVNGRHILVEPECRVLTELTGLVDFDIAISFHSGTEQIIIPNRDPKISPPNVLYPDNGELLVLASILSSSAPKKLHYKFINQSEQQYGESIFAYITKTRQVPFTYAISLWGNKLHYTNTNHQCFTNANPHSRQAKKIAKSFHPIYSNLFHYIAHRKQTKKEPLVKQKKTSSMFSLSYTYIPVYLVLLVFIGLFMAKVHIPLGWRLFYRRQRRVVSLRSLSSAFSFFLL